MVECHQANAPESLRISPLVVGGRRQLRTSNLMERLNEGIKRRIRATDPSTNEASALRVAVARSSAHLPRSRTSSRSSTPHRLPDTSANRPWTRWERCRLPAWSYGSGALKVRMAGMCEPQPALVSGGRAGEQRSEQRGRSGVISFALRRAAFRHSVASSEFAVSCHAHRIKPTQLPAARARAATVNWLPQRSKVRPSAGRRVDRPTAPTPMEGCRRRGIRRATVA